ncbi:MAG TPA: alpha-amylase family glycosyl hydrolase [Ktedonobacteraceae bacterium]|jgi:alpha-glucosidase|nr:alpha-amylase family glycosyl hydrolase [Ktedonobacteraceae bacterium]
MSRAHDIQPHQPLWWQSGVIYQIYPRSFKDSNGDGVGDLAGIIEKLDYLSWLGVEALWLSPIYPSPMVDFGYDISNFTGIDPLFGELATFDKLVAQAHQRNLKIIMDYVPNHSSDRHPWFIASRSARDNPKRDWYVWADPKSDGSPPNNWLANWGGSAWEWDAATGQYYLHSYHKAMPDLNWRNPAVKAAMFDVARFWLDRGVDGLRVDSAHYIMKDPLMRDNPSNPHPGGYKPITDYDAQLHINDKAHPDAHQVYRELRQLLDSYSEKSPRMAVGEMHIFDWPVWASYYGLQLDEMHMPLNFGLLTIPWQAAAVRNLVHAVEAALPPGAWPNYVLSNHDEPRIATRVGAEQARVAMVLLLTLRGTPTLYYGEEIGMRDGEIPPEYVQDPWEIGQPGKGVGRDPERTPMQWDASPNAGFCPPAVKPWLPISSGYKQLNIAVEREDSHSMLTLTRMLLQLRRATPALTAGSYASIENAPDDCFIYMRQSEHQRFLIALNFSDNEQRIRLAGLDNGRILLSTHLDREEPVELTSLDLRGNEGCVIEVERSSAAKNPNRG